MLRLCLELGVLHPDFLSLMLTPRQLEDWILFDRIEPIDKTFRLEQVIAILTANVVDILRSYFGKNGRNKNTDPAIFINWLQRDVEFNKEDAYNEKLKRMSQREKVDSIADRLERMFGGDSE